VESVRAEQGGVANEFAPIDPPIPKLLLQHWDPDMLLFSHLIPPLIDAEKSRTTLAVCLSA
jgi:hypothetical protein